MKILLLDAHNLLYRSFVSLPASITTRDGQSIHALYGAIAAMLRLTRELGTDRIVAAFDVPEVPTFRHQRYAAYQGQRGPLGGEQAADFSRQVEAAKDGLPRVGVPALTSPGFEADDILATLATRAAGAKESSVLVSTDRDLLQLVRPGIEVLSPGPKPLHVRDAAGVRERLGVSPEGVTTFKALAGDASDNIPGVKGIGSKSAVELVNRLGPLERIYGRLAELPGRTAALLEAGRDDAFLFRDIVTLRTDLELPVAVDELPEPQFRVDSKVREVLAAAGYD